VRQDPGRLGQALILEKVTILWMVTEAGCSIYAGLEARSLILLAFGIDSVIELLSALLLHWRLELEAQNAPLERIEQAEGRATKASGYLLYALALYVLLQAIWNLHGVQVSENSRVGLIVALVAALCMPFLARAKIKLADEIGSAALRADGMQTFTCGYLSWVLLGGMVAKVTLGWWWLDAVGALVLVPFLIREAREALAGGCHCQGSCG
jgi:divalent metal cation (Fe/Co/Zn/Cd) transporter